MRKLHVVAQWGEGGYCTEHHRVWQGCVILALLPEMGYLFCGKRWFLFDHLYEKILLFNSWILFFTYLNNRKNSYLLTLQMLWSAGAELCQVQGPELCPTLTGRWQRPSDLSHCPFLQGLHWQAAIMESGDLNSGTPMWNADIPCGILTVRSDACPVIRFEWRYI